MVTTRKQEEIHKLFTAVQNLGLSVLPDHFNKPYFTLVSDRDRIYQISLDSLSRVKVVVIFHEYAYSNTLEDRRNAIKTAKDIFEFYHDFRAGHFEQIHESLKDKKLPTLGLYYKNESSEKRVVVTSTRYHDYDYLFFHMDEYIQKFDTDLDQLTQLIKEDFDAGGLTSRWEKEVQVGKSWWRH